MNEFESKEFKRIFTEKALRDLKEEIRKFVNGTNALSDELELDIEFGQKNDNEIDTKKFS